MRGLENKKQERNKHKELTLIELGWSLCSIYFRNLVSRPFYTVAIVTLYIWDASTGESVDRTRIIRLVSPA